MKDRLEIEERPPDEEAEAGQATLGGGDNGRELGPMDPDWEPIDRSNSVASSIMINLTVLMFSALILIAIFVNYTYSVLPEEAASRYAPYVIIPYIVIFAVTVTVYGWRLISRLILDPLNEIIEGTRRLAAGDLDRRVDIEDDNELGQLGGAFNDMAETIQIGRLELEHNLEELRRVNEHLAQTQRELLSSEKLASVGRLAAGVAHEIGNPLAAIAGYLDIIGRRDYIREPEAEMLQRVRKEVDRINETIRELLDYSRPEEPGKAPIDLNDCIESALTLLVAQRGFDNIEIQKDLGQIPLLSGNRSSMQQLIMNLALNAMHAMPGGGKLTIVTSAHSEGEGGGEDGRVALHVRDTGVGMEEEMFGRIFDPFYTTREPGQGTGLGLSICQRIVENMKGVISVKSRPGEGAEFIVSFPAARDEH